MINHSDHGIGDTSNDTDDSDCPCSGSETQFECANEGCVFCLAEDPKDIDLLADKEHQQWSHWMNYLHPKLIKDFEDELRRMDRDEYDGHLALSPGQIIDKFMGLDTVKRYMLQMGTTYKDLSEKEKESDRKEVRKKLPLYRPTRKILSYSETSFKDLCASGLAGNKRIKQQVLKDLLHQMWWSYDMIKKSFEDYYGHAWPEPDEIPSDLVPKKCIVKECKKHAYVLMDVRIETPVMMPYTRANVPFCIEHRIDKSPNEEFSMGCVAPEDGT